MSKGNTNGNKKGGDLAAVAVAYYQECGDVAATARQFGVHRNKVLSWLRKAGINTGQPLGKKMKHSQEFMQCAVDHYFANGMNAKATAEATGTSASAILRWVKNAKYLGLSVPEMPPAKKTKYTYYTREFMQEVLDYCFANGGSKKAAARKFKVNSSTITKWIEGFERFGLTLPDTIPDNSAKKPEALRREAVEWYFANGMSARETAKQYGNVTPETVLKWVRRYATPKQLEAFNERVKPKYTKDFRAEVVEYYFANGENLLQTCNHFSLPTSTVAPWITKARAQKEPTHIFNDEFRQQVLEYFYANGMDAHATARHFGIESYLTVNNWVRHSDPSLYLGDMSQEKGDMRPDEPLVSQISDLDSIDDYSYDFILMVLRYHLTSEDEGGAGEDAAKTCTEYGLPIETFRFIERKYGYPKSLAELDEIDKTHIDVDTERKFGHYSERFRTHVFEYYFSPNCRCHAKTAAQYFGICESTVKRWHAKYGYPKTIEELRWAIQTNAEVNADAEIRRANETTDPYPIDFIVGTLKFYYEHGHNRKLVLARYGISEQLLQSWIERYGDFEALSEYRERQTEADPHFRSEGNFGFTDEFIKQVLDYIYGPQTTNRITVEETAAKFGITRDSVRRIIRDHGKDYVIGSIDRGNELKSEEVAPRKKFQHYSWPFIFKVLKYFYTHDETMKSVARRFGIAESRVNDWKRRYGDRPEMAPYKAKAKRTWNRVAKYPEELKQAALKAYLEYPSKFKAISEVAKRFGISYPILDLWIRQAGVRRKS